MKCHLTDHGIGVMMILRGPGGFTGGRVCDAMVSHLDVVPTVCELIGLDPPSWLEGRSLMPLIRQERKEVNDQVFAEVNFHDGYEPQRAVRTTRWKHIRRFLERETPIVAHWDGSPSKDVFVEQGWARRRLEHEQLFDLLYDPQKSHNLIAEVEAKDAAADVRRRLESWMKSTNDPLLEGPVAPPEGAVVSNPDDMDSYDVWNYTPRREGMA